MRMRALWALAPLLLPACSSKAEIASPDTVPAVPAGSEHNADLGPDQRCPGDPGCAPGEDPTFYAGVDVEDITPTLDHVIDHASGSSDSDFNPAGGDQCVDAVTREPVAVTECVWMAVGPRPAKAIHDPTSVRCTVMKQGATKVGLCTVDCIGWFYNEVTRTRELIAKENPDLDLDLLIVAATHDHETRDTIGPYGPDTGTSGVSKPYNERIRKATRDALVKANGALAPVTIEYGAITLDGHLPGTDPAGRKANAFVSDTRDPVVIDDELRTMRFVSKADKKTVATIVNWNSHAEFSGNHTPYISADYPGALRTAIESGIDEVDADGKAVHYDGVGGTAMFVTGALGGQVGGGLVTVYGFDGKPHQDGNDRAVTYGKMVAVYALDALKNGTTTVETAQLGFRARELYMAVDNKAYQIALAQGIFDREAYYYDPTKPFDVDNVPYMKSQEIVLDVGPAEMISVPGEMHAELMFATKDGVTSVEAPYPFTPAPYFILNDTKTNPSCKVDGTSDCDDGPPDISKVDRSRVIDKFRDPKAQYRWVLGLAQDETGYVVPEYDFVLDKTAPYLDEASPGNHYEETASLGPHIERHMIDPMLQLLQTAPVVAR